MQSGNLKTRIPKLQISKSQNVDQKQLPKCKQEKTDARNKDEMQHVICETVCCEKWLLKRNRKQRLW